MNTNTDINFQESTLQKKHEIKSIQLSKIKTRTIEWIWKNRIPEGSLSIIEGDGGRGKSTIVADLCSKLSTGDLLPNDPTPRAPMNILLLATEDDPGAVLRPRFEKHKGDLDKIHFYKDPLIMNNDGAETLKKLVLDSNSKLIVIDPIVSFLGTKIDMNKATDVRSVLERFTQIGRETGCTFVIIRHFNKSREGAASQRGAGSVDFRNFSRSVLQAIYNPEDKRCYLALEKSNYAARASTLPFTIEETGVVWGAPCKLSAEELHSKSRSFGKSSAIDTAIDFLEAELITPKMAIEIQASAEQIGISKKTLQRASKILGIKKNKLANGWEWQLSNQDGQESLQEHIDHLGHLDTDTGPK